MIFKKIFKNQGFWWISLVSAAFIFGIFWSLFELNFLADLDLTIGFMILSLVISGAMVAYCYFREMKKDAAG